MLRYRFVILLAAVLAALVPPLGVAAGAARAESYPLTLTRGSRLMVAARVNDRPVTALLDSAAEATLIDPRLAAELNLGGGQTVTGQGSGQDAFEARLVSGVTLEALGQSLPDQTIAITDLTDVAQRLKLGRVEVILGREIFDAARLQIDIEGRRISVVGRDVAPRGARLDLTTEHGVETLPVTVENGPPVRATFDLGNGSQVLISAALANRMQLLSDDRKTSTERGGGLGGEAVRRIVTLKSIRIGGREFHDVPAAIDDQPSASDLNIGISILRHFRITTDFSDHVIWLDPRN